MRTALDLLAADEARSDRVLGARVREARAATSDLVNPADWLFRALGGGPVKSGATVNESTAFNVPAVAACVNILAQSIAALPLKLYRDTPSGAEEASDHPLHHLLKRKPGRNQTSYQWRVWCMVCTGLGGNGYSRIYRDRYAAVTAIEPLKPSAVQPALTRDGELVYRLSGGGETLLAHEVFHLRGLTSDGYTGRSPLADLRESIGLSLIAQEFSARSFSNGNRRPGVIEAAPNKTVAQAQEFNRFWIDNFAGAPNAGRTPIMGGGFSWKDAGFSSADAELLLTRKFEVEEIARAYRVPLTLLQSMEKSTSFGTGIAELNRGFVTHTLMPWLINWEMELEDKLLTEAEKAEGYFVKFNVAAMLRGSPLEQAQKAEIERRARLVTANEYRRQQELQETPDTGANNLDWPLNAQEAGQKSNPLAAVNAGISP